MRFFLAVIFIAVLSAIATWFLPWWMIAVVSFIVVLLVPQKKGRAFLAGFCGVGLFWLAGALVHDLPNQHILSARMAELFHLPHYSLFILVTALVGGLIGGLSAWAAGLLRR